MMLFGLENIVTVVLGIAGFMMMVYAQTRITSTYHKYRRVRNDKDLSGCEVARMILDKHGLTDIYVVKVNGTLTDHYDPKRRVIRLSKDIFDGESIASIAIAAHEASHAVQDSEQYPMMRIRSMLAPIVNLITYAGYFILLISVLGGVMAYIRISIFMVLLALLFQLITLPVEFNASKRAIVDMDDLNLVTADEKEGAKEMLASAALTYVASFLSSILSLLRLLIMKQNQDR